MAISTKVISLKDQCDLTIEAMTGLINAQNTMISLLGQLRNGTVTLEIPEMLTSMENKVGKRVAATGRGKTIAPDGSVISNVVPSTTNASDSSTPSGGGGSSTPSGGGSSTPSGDGGSSTPSGGGGSTPSGDGGSSTPSGSSSIAVSDDRQQPGKTYTNQEIASLPGVMSAFKQTELWKVELNSVVGYHGATDTSILEGQINRIFMIEGNPEDTFGDRFKLLQAAHGLGASEQKVVWGGTYYDVSQLVNNVKNLREKT